MGRRVKVTAEEAEPVFNVWDMNWPAVKVFLALATQWRVVGLSSFAGASLHRMGLDYAAIPPTLDLLGIRKRKARRDVFARLQLLEQFAIGVFGELRT